MGELAVQQAVENLILNVSAAYYNVLVQHHKLIAARHSLELSMNVMMRPEYVTRLGIDPG